MKRVSVIGPPGSGKSTVARRIGEALGLPVIHMDTLFWRPGWVPPDDPNEVHDRVREIAKGDAWVIDGNYSRSLRDRFERADAIVFLDLPRWLCLSRVLKRRIQYARRSRPDMTEGCPERLDREFWRWARNWHGESRDTKYRLLRESSSEGKTVVLGSPRAVDRYVRTLRPDAR